MLTNQILRDHFPLNKIVFVVGPRQVGKTTIAKQLLESRKSEYLYRNWDDLEWRRAISRKPYGFIDTYRPKQSNIKPLVVLDEIHKFPRWKRYVKGLWDTRKDSMDLLVTGSGRLDVYQKGGDSLLGRYHQYRLHPLSVREVVDQLPPEKNYKPEDTLEMFLGISSGPKANALNAFRDLLKWGGFPNPFLGKSEQQLRLWHRERRHLIVREDLRDLSKIQLVSHVEEMVELIVPRAGSILSLNSLREDLQVALDSVRLWTSYLERLYFIYLVRPYAGKVARALKREPKVYLWDWSEIPDEGARFENMVASHLLKWCHFCEDWGYPKLSLHFVRDKEKREVDFLVTKDRKPWLLIEAKLSEKNPNNAIHYFAEKLGVKHTFQIVANLDRTGQAGDVHVVDAANFLASLPV
ncbi:MAG: ATP-binding protein [Deltaproteobacteria bacterium]|nr:ATP-binding protein [Deltaproteobacteria bacterium]